MVTGATPHGSEVVTAMSFRPLCIVTPAARHMLAVQEDLQASFIWINQQHLCVATAVHELSRRIDPTR